MRKIIYDSFLSIQPSPISSRKKSRKLCLIHFSQNHALVNFYSNGIRSNIHLHDVHCIDGSCTQKIKYLNVCCTLTLSRRYINKLFLKMQNRKRVFLIYVTDLCRVQNIHFHIVPVMLRHDFIILSPNL